VLSGGNAVAADFDGDGRLDVAMFAASGIAVIPGLGDGTFGASLSLFSPTFYPRAFTTGDINGDGIADELQFSSNFTPDGGPQTLTIWTSVPVASYSATAIMFGTQNPGTISAPIVLTLANAGNAPMNVTSITASAEFGQTNSCPAILPI